MALTSIVSMTMASGTSTFSPECTRIAVAGTARRNANNVVTFTAWRHGSNEEHRMEIWPTGNLVTVVNGVSQNQSLWGTSFGSSHNNPARGARLNSSARSQTMQQGFVQTNARVRRSAVAGWSTTIWVRTSWN